jgi:biotin carboxyl carrier protein
VWLAQQRCAPPDGGAWYDAGLTGWRLRRGPAVPTATHQVSMGEAHWRIGFGAGSRPASCVVRVDDACFEVELAGERRTVSVDGRSLQLRAYAEANQVHAAFAGCDVMLDVRLLHGDRAGGTAAQHGIVRAPMMGVLVAVDVRSGQAVQQGDRLGTLESMKMEMAITAPVAGRVAWIGCVPRGKVERHQELFRIEA